MATRCLSSFPLLSPSGSGKACAVVRAQPAPSAAARSRIRTHLSVATGGEQQLVTAQEPSQEPEYGVVSIHHVGILCENLERSMSFYKDLLGLKVNPARPTDKLPYRGAWLWVGSEMIHLMELPNPDPLTGRPEHGGRDRHTCIAIKDVLKLKEIFEKAVEQAIHCSLLTAQRCQELKTQGQQEPGYLLMASMLEIELVNFNVTCQNPWIGIW